MTFDNHVLFPSLMYHQLTKNTLNESKLWPK